MDYDGVDLEMNDHMITWALLPAARSASETNGIIYGMDNVGWNAIMRGYEEE